MPSYLVGAKSSFVPTQLYQPDFNAIGGLLRIKQSQYDAGYNQLKNVYNSVLNSPLTRTQNIQARDQILQNARDRLKEITQKDLSISGVKREALSMFDPFLENDNITHDINFTRKSTSEIQKAFSLKNSTKSEDREQYWETGVQDIYNSIEDYRNASDEDALNFRARSYVPYQDMQAYLRKAVKESGMKVTTTSDGNKPLIYTTENGPGSVKSFRTWAAAQIGDRFNDMLAVQGRVYMHGLKKQYTDMGLSEEAAKEKVAADYLANSYNDLHAQLGEITTQKNELETQLKQYATKDSNGVWLADRNNPNNFAKAQDILRQIDELSVQESDYTDNINRIKDLNNPEKGYGGNLFKKIINDGASFFANEFKNRMLNNFAVGEAANSSVTVKNNEAYWASLRNDRDNLEYQLKLKKDDRDERELQEKIKSGYFTKKGMVDTDGDGIAETYVSGSGSSGSGGSKPTGSDGQWVGENSIDPAHVKDPYQEAVNALTSKYQAAKSAQIEGIMNLLPALEIPKEDGTTFNATDADMIRGILNNSFSNNQTKFNWTPESRMAEKAIRNYLKNNGYNLPGHSPSAMLQALGEKIGNIYTAKFDSGAIISPNEIEAIKQYQDGRQLEEDWSIDNNAFKASIDNVIKNKYKDSPFVKQVEDGGKLRYDFISIDDIGKDFEKIAQNLQHRDTYKVSIPTTPFSVSNTLERSARMSGKQLAEAFMNGEVGLWKNPETIYVKGSGHEDTYGTIMIKGEKYQVDPSLIPELRRLKDKYGDIDHLKKVRESINKDVAESYKNTSPTGFIGQKINYTVGAKPNGGEETTGFKLIKEIGTPSNRNGYADVRGPVTSPGLNQSYDLLLNSMSKGGDNAKIVSGLDYNTLSSNGRSIDLVFTDELLKGKKYEEYGLDEEQARNLVTNGLTVYLDPNAKGDYISKLPTPKRYQLYDFIKNGKVHEASPLEKAMGFDYKIWPDNVSDPNRPAKSIRLQINSKVRDVKQRAYVPNTSNSATPEIFSLDEYSPDEIMTEIHNRVIRHIMLNNQLLQQEKALYPSQTPDLAPLK